MSVSFNENLAIMSIFRNLVSAVQNVFKSQHHKLHELPAHQIKQIKNSIWILNIIVTIIVMSLNLKVHNMSAKQNLLIDKQITLNNEQIKYTDKFRQDYTKPIAAQVFLTDDRMLDIKSQTLSMPFIVAMHYPESWYPSNTYPTISLDNGMINNQTVQYKKVKNGMVEIVIAYQATINTSYTTIMYPLDKQFLWLNLSIMGDNESYTNTPYLSIDEFHRNPPLYKSRNYFMIKDGFLNVAKVTKIKIGDEYRTFTDMNNLNYLIYSHKNIFSYLKTTQYLIFAVTIAIFALLINQQSGMAISGRISVIGSSVFSLSANVFQINSLLNQSSGIILIDILSFFTASVVILCFLITIHTIKINEKFSYEAAKLYDLFAFRSMLVQIVIFFILVYWQS